MRKNFLHGVIMVTLTVFFYSCQKHKDIPISNQGEQSASSNRLHGHLKQTKTFSSDALLRWMDFQLTKYRDNFASKRRRKEGIQLFFFFFEEEKHVTKFLTSLS